MSEIKAKSASDWGLSMTEAASRRIKSLVQSDPESPYLRVTVLGGGCSGFQYSFSLDDTRNDDDLALERDGATMLVDEMSISLLQGSEVDFEQTLAASMFVIRNPNATSSCGCGSSFSIG